MTLRRRWTLSILAILALFSLNLAVYFWGNAQRTRSILDLKVALERKDLVVEIRNTIEERQRDAEVMEPLIESGSVDLDAGELSDMEDRTSSIAQQISRFQALSGSSASRQLMTLFERLGRSWLALYRHAQTSVEQKTDAFQEIYAEIESHLGLLESTEAALARDAEERFSSVADLTDRLTLGIFILSTGLAVGIALWFSRFLRRAFARYVTAEVVDSVLESPEGLELGGEKREITVLMADLRGFSSLAERLPAEHVVAVINNFLGSMTEIIVDAGGTIDEFIGDAILVLFGAPASRSDHAEAAVACALRMQRAMVEVNDKNRAGDLPEVEMGIGIHSGEVVVGNIGSKKRTKYGAVGSSVNLAGRIESNTVGGQILISEVTRQMISSEVRVDGRLEIRPKGLGEPVTLLDIGGLGSGEDLQLPRIEDRMKRLPGPVPVEIWVLEGKLASGTSFDGVVVMLSARGAVVRSQAFLEPLTDLRLELSGERPSGLAVASDVVPFYAKVIALDGQPADTFAVRFTSIPPEVAERIEQLLA